MREDYLEQIEKLNREIFALTSERKETEIKIEQKVRNAEVLEARLSAVDSIIEATSLISTFTTKVSDLEKENSRLLNTILALEQSLEEANELKLEVSNLKTQLQTTEVEKESLQKQLANFGQSRRVRVPAGGEIEDLPITAAGQPVQDEISASPNPPIDENLLTTDKKKSLSPDSLLG